MGHLGEKDLTSSIKNAIAWYRKTNPIPDSPFQLNKTSRISDPAKFRARLEAAIARFDGKATYVAEAQILLKIRALYQFHRHSVDRQG